MLPLPLTECILYYVFCIILFINMCYRSTIVKSLRFTDLGFALVYRYSLNAGCKDDFFCLIIHIINYKMLLNIQCPM